MKKKYVSPCTKCVTINSTEIICGSPLIYGGDGNGIPAEVRRRIRGTHIYEDIIEPEDFTEE